MLLNLAAFNGFCSFLTSQFHPDTLWVKNTKPQKRNPNHTGKQANEKKTTRGVFSWCLIPVTVEGHRVPWDGERGASPACSPSNPTRNASHFFPSDPTKTLSLAQPWLEELCSSCSSSAASSHRRATSPVPLRLPAGPSGEPAQGTAKKRLFLTQISS